MPDEVKNIAIIGANREGLSLLPIILKDEAQSRLLMIADANNNAMLFKLNELGYRIPEHFGVKTTSDLADLKKLPCLDIIINTVRDHATEAFLEQPEFKGIEKLGPLSARLIWGARVSAETSRREMGVVNGQEALLSSLREIVDAVRLSVDRKELLLVILQLAIESTEADRGSIMIVSKEDGLLRVEIARGIDEAIIKKIRVPLGEGIAGWVAREGKPLLISGKADSGAFDRLKDRKDVKSALCVPLSINGETIGVMNVNNSDSPTAFSQEDLTFMTKLSTLASEVIHRSNEYEKMRVDSAKLKLWKEAELVMTSLIPIERRLNTICKKLVDTIPGLVCFIYLYDEDQKRLTLKSGSIRDISALGPLHLTEGEGIEGSIIRKPRDVVLVERSPANNLKSVYLSLPMIVEEHFVGVLNGQFVSSRELSVYHEALIKEIRNLIASRIYTEKRNEREALRTKKLFAVDETGLEMVTMKNPKKLLNIIATSPAAILGAEGATLRLRKDEKSPYLIMATYGLDDNVIKNYFLPLEKEVVMEVLRNKKTANRVFSEEISPYIRSILSHPLTIDDEIIGTINVFNKVDQGAVPPCAFSATDQEILFRFAVYVERALASYYKAGPKTLARAAPPAAPPLVFFEKEVEEELNRSRRTGKSLVLVTVRFAGLTSAGVRDRADFESRVLSFLKNKVRNFDMMLWLNEDTIGILFLETGRKMIRMLANIPQALRSEKEVYTAFHEGRVEINYGYAVFPEDGGTFSSLFAKASKRIKVNFK